MHCRLLTLGWQVVKAYESDELALDNEDAKCLEKAKKSAEQKDLKSTCKRAAAQRGGRSSYKWQGQPTAPKGDSQYSTQGNFGLIWNTFGPSQGGGMRPKQLEPCFNCLEMGHLKANCPS